MFAPHLHEQSAVCVERSLADQRMTQALVPRLYDSYRMVTKCLLNDAPAGCTYWRPVTMVINLNPRCRYLWTMIMFVSDFRPGHEHRETNRSIVITRIHSFQERERAVASISTGAWNSFTARQTTNATSEIFDFITFQDGLIGCESFLQWRSIEDDFHNPSFIFKPSSASANTIGLHPYHEF